jgi:hypothetical protein
VAGASGTTQEFRGRFGVCTRQDIAALPAADEAPDNESAYPIRIRSALIARLGAARRIPDVRRPGDLRMLERLTNDYPALGSDRGWNARFGRELNCTEDRSHLGSTGLPVLEGKHIQPFLADTAAARFRIEESTARHLLPQATFTRPRVGYRDVSGVSNRLSLIAALIPAGVVTTHTLLCARTAMDEVRQHFLCGVFNSYVLNAIVRMLMGGHVTTSLVESLPVPPWTGGQAQLRIARLARRLSQAPQRAHTRARLQALVAVMYQFDRATYAELLTGFPLVPQAERTLALESFERLRQR